MTLLWNPDYTSKPVGFVPVGGNWIPGFQDAPWEVYDGVGNIQAGADLNIALADDGVTKAVHPYMASAASSGIAQGDTQRAEVVPAYQPPATEGYTFWLGWDFEMDVWTQTTGTTWGPLIWQGRRNNRNGNGPMSISIHSGNIVVEGASGYYNGLAVTLPAGMGGGSATSSVINMGAVPASGTVTRLVLGITLHRTNGRIQAYRDGVSKGDVQPWIAKDTSSDGAASGAQLVSSTLPPESGSGVTLKHGLYRGAMGTISSKIYGFKAATTKAEVDTGTGGGAVGKAPSDGVPTQPSTTQSLSNTSTTMPMPAKPANLVEGDLIFCLIYLAREVNITMPSRPAGYAWQQLGTRYDDTPGTFSTHIFWTREDLAGTNWTTSDLITWDGVSSEHNAICVVVQDGILVGDPQDAAMTSNQGTGTTVTYTGLTTVNPNTLLLTYSQNSNNVDPSTQPSGFSSIYFGSAGMSAYKVQASPGATGALTQTMAAAPGSWHAHLIAVRAEPALNASFTVTPVSGEVNQPTVFDASASAGSITRMLWEFPSVGQDDSALAFTGSNTTDTLTRTSSGTHTYANGDKVRVVTKTGGTGVTSQHYFVRDATSTTLKLAATAGGAAVDLGSDISAISLLRVTFTWSWTSSGTKNIGLTAFDAFGAEATDSDTTIVTPTDSIAPVTTITSPGSGDDFSVTSVTVLWTRNEAGCTSEVKVDGGAYFSVGSATSYTANYAVGTHTVQVRSTDPSLNIEGTDPGPSGSVTTPPSVSFNILGTGSLPTEWWGVLA